MNAIKYTCPRCGIHTCSLPCVKKHKAWAQCSGIRNPAEYRKRADLATPASVDKDFNFITNVERAITKADDQVLDRGITLAPARQLRNIDARSKADLELESRGIKVVRAPRGLSRAKQNKTHWAGQQKSIMWTIEWICADGEKIIGHALDTRTLGEAYISNVGKKKIRQKRKLNQLDQSTTQPSCKTVKQDADGLPQYSATREEQVPTDQQPSISEHERLLGGMHFYLHNPQTSSKFKCLIPSLPAHTVGAALSGQTVLEFPTFYVISQSPELLQPPYISQEKYEQQHGGDVPINLAMPLEDGEITEPNESTLVAGVLPEKVMEVLARDLAG